MRDLALGGSFFLAGVEAGFFARFDGRPAREEPLIKLVAEVAVAAADLHVGDLTAARELVESRRAEAHVPSGLSRNEHVQSGGVV